jgi:hypothetical protein
MHSRLTLFIVSAVLELGAGLALLSVPGMVIALAFGVPEAAPEALMAARIGGAGLLAIGTACWLARHDGVSLSQDGLLWGILLYNVGASAVLTYAGLLMSLVGAGLWPGVSLHGAMAVWCALNLRVLPGQAMRA